VGVNNKRAMAARAQLAPDADADLLLLDAETLELRYVIARGEVLRRARAPEPGALHGARAAPGSGARARAPRCTPPGSTPICTCSGPRHAALAWQAHGARRQVHSALLCRPPRAAPPRS
jgi:hypothetical protein